MNNNQKSSGNSDVAPNIPVENILASSQNLSDRKITSGSEVSNMQATLDAMMDTTVEFIPLDKDEINNALPFYTNEIHKTSDGIFELTAEQISQLHTHPLLGIIPTMNKVEYDLLLENINEHGFLAPITITRNLEIIDGRARVEMYNNEHIISFPNFVYFDGDENSILDYIVSKNLVRRHLNQGQKAVAALKLYEILKTKNAADKSTTLASVENQIEAVVSSKIKSKRKNSRDRAAQCLGVSSAYIGKASKINSIDQDLLQKVFQNEISLEKAYSTCNRIMKESTNTLSDKVSMNPVEEYESQYEPIGSVAKKSILLLITFGVKERDAQKFILAKMDSEKKRKTEWELKSDEEKLHIYLEDFKEFMKRLKPDSYEEFSKRIKIKKSGKDSLTLLQKINKVKTNLNDEEVLHFDNSVNVTIMRMTTIPDEPCLLDIIKQFVKDIEEEIKNG